jgi:hypothetical protein
MARGTLFHPDLKHLFSQAEHEKNTKENQIKTLQGEMAQQDEHIAKLNKEKKHMVFPCKEYPNHK